MTPQGVTHIRRGGKISPLFYNLKTNQMKARIKIRTVYYKYAEIEINFPSTELHNATDYIMEKETEWGHELQSAIDKAEFEHGNGMDSDDGWTDEKSEQEVRYEVDPDGDSYREGGHL